MKLKILDDFEYSTKLVSFLKEKHTEEEISNYFDEIKEYYSYFKGSSRSKAIIKNIEVVRKTIFKMIKYATNELKTDNIK
ncbi:MAG: hypothetical protein LBV51_05815 [Acholeplasmatales bacterium]|jgi:hypothetical protein|nr:hypothetical protein [Acholeplasmatales bacterium]